MQNPPPCMKIQKTRLVSLMYCILVTTDNLSKYLSLGHSHSAASKASLYAMACNPSGSLLATGSPEKVRLKFQINDIITLQTDILVGSKALGSTCRKAGWQAHRAHRQYTCFAGQPRRHACKWYNFDSLIFNCLFI